MNAADLIRDARSRARLTQAELAGASGTSQATISAYEHGAKTPTPDMRLTAVPASAPVRVPGAGELDRRSRLLAQVLDLAERLPARHSPKLRFPRLPSPRST